MTSFMIWRVRLRKFIQTHEVGVTRTFHGVVMLVCLLIIASAFPFATGLNRAWIVVPLAVVGGFIPMSAQALVLTMYLLLNLFSLSHALAGATAIMFVIGYFFCGVYHAGRVNHMMHMTCARIIRVPFLIPVEAGLLRDANEAVSILAGSVISFFLQEVYANSNVFREGDSQMTVVDFLQEKLVANQMFYVYLLAMMALFLIVYVLRTRNIRHSWVVAVCGGVSVEFLIMLAGYLFVDSRRSVPNLVIANIITLFVGLATSYLRQDLDYSRVEKVQFEDDEYYYYVTAVPKVVLAEEKKEIKHIHRAERREK